MTKNANLAARTILLLGTEPYSARPLDTSMLFNMAAALLGRPNVSFPVSVTEDMLRHDIGVVANRLNDTALRALAA